MARKTFLVTLTVAVEASDEESRSGLSELEELEQRLIESVDAALGNPERPLGWQATWSTELDPASINCGQCAVCGSWVTDRERPDSHIGLCNGARVEGRLLCDEHLPPGHRWAF
ncbi:MAG TPA: hypothetical protein VF815_15470 [Myxococcaceae bacterium]